MAFTWNWNRKIGEAIIYNFDKDVTYNLYQGNGFLIFIYEYEQDGKDMYSVHSFFMDEEHAKIMLGLKAGSDQKKENYMNKPDSYQLKKIRLNKKEYKYTKKLVDMLTKAFDEIIIELYSEEFTD